MKIKSFEEYAGATTAKQKAFREKAVKEVLAGGKRREIARRYFVDGRTLAFWVRLDAGCSVAKQKVKRKKGMPGWKQKWMQTRTEAVAAVEAGEKQNVVAKRFGVTRQAICQWVKADAEEPGHGLRHLTELQRRKVRKKVVAMVKVGISQAATARRFGVSEISVGKWLKLFDRGGLSALDIVSFEGEAAKHKTEKTKEEREKEEERFHLRFDIQERPIVVDQAAGRRFAENFVGKIVVCHNEDHNIVGAYFDKTLGIVLSYIHVPIEEDPTP